MEYSFHPLGENGVLIEVGTDITLESHQNIQMITSFLDEHPPIWMIEYIPAYTTVSIFYKPDMIFKNLDKECPFDYICKELKKLLSHLTRIDSKEGRIVQVPVCYGGEFGPDLEHVASINGLTPDEVVQIHSSGDYLVYMIGFAPGFPYIGGMSEEIAAPRRESPRLKIPPGTVGIAGKQTGIYSIETPGGWQLIGRTPLDLFTPNEYPPSLLKAGDKIKFKPISFKEYTEWRRKK